jgi:hypothetical protein
MMVMMILSLTAFDSACFCRSQAIKSIERVGLDAMAAEAGIDLWKLPFEDARPERLAYLAENKGKVPVVSGTAKQQVFVLCALYLVHWVQLVGAHLADWWWGQQLQAYPKSIGAVSVALGAIY